MNKLILLKNNGNQKTSSNKIFYYCQECALIEGILAYYPEIRNKIEVIYVDYPRPRIEIIKLIGDQFQSCPVLILDTDVVVIGNVNIIENNNMLFINSIKEIVIFLEDNYITKKENLKPIYSHAH